MENNKGDFLFDITERKSNKVDNDNKSNNNGFTFEVEDRLKKEKKSENINYFKKEVNNDNTLNEINNIQENDFVLLRCFMGNAYEKITTRLFNIWALLFGPLYLYVRKMVGLGLLLSIFEFWVLLLTKEIVVFLVNIIIVNLLLSVTFNKIYSKHGLKIIKKIKQQNISNEEIKKYCTSRGSTDFDYLFLGLILQVILINVIVVIYLYYQSPFQVNELISKVLDYWKNFL